MKTNLPLLQILAISALASCANMHKKAPVSFQAGSSPPPVESQTEELYKAVNAYRAAKGVSELQRHAGLERLAREHCEYLQKHRGTFSVHGKNISHMGDSGRSLMATRRFGMMMNSCENVAWIEKHGSETKNGRGLVQMWSQSPNHDWAMSDDGWTHTGIGTVVDEDGSVFATQLFCTKDISLSTFRDRLNPEF